MGPRYPELTCTECGKHVRLIAVCENPDTENETRFYECSSAECRYAFRACVPNLRAQGGEGPRVDLASHAS
jgi:hypothetical protein